MPLEQKVSIVFGERIDDRKISFIFALQTDNANAQISSATLEINSHVPCPSGTIDSYEIVQYQRPNNLCKLFAIKFDVENSPHDSPYVVWGVSARCIVTGIAFRPEEVSIPPQPILILGPGRGV